MLGFIFSLFAQDELTRLEFKDFPLRKIDTIYSHNGDKVAYLLINIWEELLDVSSQYKISQDKRDLQNACTKTIPPLCAKLKTFKRFANELIIEWSEKRNKSEDVTLFLKELFLCKKRKVYINTVSEEQSLIFLQSLASLIKDLYYNAPYACEKSKQRDLKEAYQYLYETIENQLLF
jgi:hypothetical protein